jgi:N,N-dimethylformamidase beta subunit-like, C-terminal
LPTVLRGYLAGFSVGPGSALAARLSGEAGPAEAAVVRLSHSDPNPAGPGFLAQPCAWDVKAVGPVAPQASPTGSYGVIEAPFQSCPQGFALLAWVLPTRAEEEVVVFSWATPDDDAALVITAEGHWCLRSDRRGVVLRAPHEVRERHWYFVAVGVGQNTGLAWGAVGRTGGPYQVAGPRDGSLLPAAASPLLLGARSGPTGPPQGAMDGKIARPALLDHFPDGIALMDIMNFGAERAARQNVLACWGFGAPDDPDRIVDLSGHGHHGVLVNGASSGVMGPPDNAGAGGEEAPAGPPFGAVHLHTDDLEDCRWVDTHSVEVPASAPSAIYALRARDGADDLYLPFVVRPDRDLPVLFLVPTYTWQAYANLGRDPADYPGLSHYALHRDGSPVFITTRLKPAPATGPLARVEVDGVDSFISHDEASATSGASHLLMADLYANWWLESTGAEFGVITDEDLHRGGGGALGGCRLLVLSAHPEYWTAEMLDALSGFIDHGGSVMYLGGNGLYWVTSVHPAKPHLLEVRRCAGSQTSAAPYGEGTHVFSGLRGGIWAGQARPPDQLVGVGFAGFGWDQGVAYQRTEASYGERFGWVFEGVESGEVGAAGLNMGGAVAFEYDRCDAGLAPAGSTVLATAVPGSGGFFRKYEDGPGRAPDPLVRCDMTIRETEDGGVVFSLG